MANIPVDHNALNDENIVYIENDRIRLGVNLALGGVVTFLAEHGHDNLINSHDWGRQVQMSFYNYPIPFEPEGFEVRSAWKGLGWNPIQCGDCFGHRSKILEHRCENGEIYVKCIPMHWPLDDYPGECTFETWYKLDGSCVNVTARLNNARPDTTRYPARSQELPAVYTNGVWHRLISYIGNTPFTGDAVTEVCSKENGLGWPWEWYYPTEHWSALVDDGDYGLGVYNAATAVSLGGFSGVKGVGGPKDASTGYISPIQDEILDHDIVYTYGYTLIVGELADIRTCAARLEAQRTAPRSWSFEKDRGHFTYCDITDAGLPENGCLEFTAAAGGALCSPVEFIPAESSRIVLDAAFTGGEMPATLRLTLNNAQSQRMNEVQTITQDLPVTLNGDGVRKEHVLDITAAPAAVRFELVFGGATDAKVWAARVE